MSSTTSITFTASTPEELLSDIRRFVAVGNEPLPAIEQIEVAGFVPAKPRGRPRKESVDPVASPAPVAVEPAAAAPVPVVAEVVAAASSSVDKAAVQQALIAVVQRIGKKECTDLCIAHGAPNLSAIDPSKYGALHAAAQAALASIAN